MRPLLLITFLCSNAGLFAQAYIGDPGLQKSRQPAAIIRLPYEDNTIEDALKQYMMTRGYKSTASGGFILFRSTPMEVADTILNDLYFRTNAAGRKEKDMTLLSLTPVPKNQGLMARTLADSIQLEKARLFLDSLAPFIAAYQIRLQINDQQEQLAKAQKKMNDFKANQADLEKKIRYLQTDLDRNQRDQVKAAADLKTSINADDDGKKKYQKRVNRLLDEESSLQKKLRQAQQDLEDNKNDISRQQEDVNKHQQGLDAIRSRYSAN